MRATVARFAVAALATAMLAGCNLEGDMGFVEIRTVPVSTLAPPPPLYLDSEKLDPMKKGNAVLRQRVGTAKLQVEASNGNLAPLCDLVVKKNRITTVTITVVERPPRCQCRTSSSTDRTANRTCVS
jgi:hypothetical protein